MSDTDDETDDRKDEISSEAVAHVRYLYDSGFPFFTKDRIRGVYEELQRNGQPGNKVRIEGLDGKFDQFKIRNGMYCDEEEGLEYIFEKPIIHYDSIQGLLDPDMVGYWSPYTNIRIYHQLLTRDKLTKRITNPVYVTSLEEVRVSLGTTLQMWKASESWKQLKYKFGCLQNLNINKMVAFALGPIQAFAEEKHSNRSSFQHALIISLHELLRDVSNGSDIKCYAQDPAYTKHDTAILETFGVTVLPDPEGFLEVDDSTIVVSISPNVAVKQVVSDIARPAIIIWNRIEEIDQRCTDPDSPRLRTWILAHYDSFDFPGDWDYFGDLVVYIQRPNSTEGDRVSSLA
ncbi:hypothetical protein BGW36DRAFT_429773 [Talaromyces proteolyticus]|uniref:SRR1-like domain-containing protein n=1 Tax=Talaromyces proteolyticus TaxID=1131652 RepID=A0AAD4KMI7_9EURO|nr:uncharacterized protein BGW36DRAFT_429773 [Talaromyces proteolyticus]KAH8693740.1 hypothetical protein BGW36DRAFT_429773 [Talaromyces proteolyticus]